MSISYPQLFLCTSLISFVPSITVTLPLWSPTPVDLGAVGYLSKPSGTFVTLFNVFQPGQSDNPVVQDMPSIYGYGNVAVGNQRKDERSAAQRSMDMFVGKLMFRSRGSSNISFVLIFYCGISTKTCRHCRQSVARRYSFPLRSGHKTAYMCTETTLYSYMDNLHAPKKWFKTNVGLILQTFGKEHQIQKEDLLLGQCSSALFIPSVFELMWNYSHWNAQDTQLCSLCQPPSP